MSQQEAIAACKNEECALRMRCRRFTGPNTVGTATYKPKKAHAHWVCNHYWFNGQMQAL
jgi:hypothetical protein